MAVSPRYEPKISHSEPQTDPMAGHLLLPEHFLNWRGSVKKKSLKKILKRIGIAAIIFASSPFVLWQTKIAPKIDLNASGPESKLNHQPILHRSSGNDTLDLNTVSRHFFSDRLIDLATWRSSPSNSSSMMSPQLRQYIAATGDIALNDDGAGEGDGDGESFSACLLIMDDNHRLSEWIGYHYFAMPLRYLVVAIDPHSKTSPSRILDRWRDRMSIVEWTDSNFTDKSLIIDNTDNFSKKKYKHLTRQVDFYLQCTRHLQNHNRTWTSYHDVDEFISINSDDVSHAQEIFRQPGSILRMVKRYSEPTKSTNNTTQIEKVGSHNDTITVATEPEYWFKHFQLSCCITLPRVLYGAVESTDEDVAQGVPSIFVKNSKQFDTLRWRYRTTSPRGTSDGLAKSIMDVSKLRPEDYNGGSAVHKALKSVCPHTWLKYDFPLGFHHYLGSWEQYSFREDARKGVIRTLETWKERSLKKGGGVDDEVRGWLAGFVELVGEAAAIDLLGDVGLPPNYTKSDMDTATWAKNGRRRR